MTYQQIIKENLGHYRKDVLQVDTAGIYNYRGRELRHDHILPKTKYTLNILETYRADFFSSEYSDINLHKYFHHLNSSQALCINLFFPLIMEEKLELISELLNLPEGDIANPAFEFESDVEQTGRRKTNFDFYFEILRKLRIYFELKYTEQNFGDARNDHSHRDKFEKTYRPLLRDNRYIREEYKTMILFFENYQILRNLLHIVDDSKVVFLYPEANGEICDQAKRSVDMMVTDQGRERFKLLSLEETVTHVTSGLKPGRLKSHFDEFERKYLITSKTIKR